MPDPRSHGASARSAALLGAAVNIALAVGKLVAGIVGNSHALIADAVESLTDLIGSAVIVGGLHVASRPPDRNHPYGHGKAEAVAALVVCGLLLGAGVWIAVSSVHEIRTPHAMPEPWTLLVLVGVVVVKEGMFRWSLRVSRRTGSGAVHADAWHHRADAITSVAAFVGISVALLGQRFGHAGVAWQTADDWAALFAAGVIMYNAFTLLRIPLHELMDAASPADVERVVAPSRAVAQSVEGVRRVEKVLARKSGTGYFLDMHVQVDPEMPVREAHAVGGRVRARVRAEVDAVRDVLIHVEPADTDQERVL
jgi:cation diffusion facilitator family transporter